MKKLLASGALVALLSTTALAQDAAVKKGPSFAISGTSEFYYKDVDSQIASQKGDSMGNSDNEIKFTFSNKSDAGLDYGMVVEMATVADSSATIDESSIYISGSAGKLILGGNDAVTDNFGIGEQDIMDEEVTGTYTNASIQTNAGEKTYGDDSDKVSYISPSFGGIQAGVSYMDSGATGTTDSTSYGASYTHENIKIGYTKGMQEVSGAIDNESQSIGAKVSFGAVSFIGAMSTVEGADEDIETIGAGASYAINNTTTVAVSTMESEDALDVSGTEKENLKQNMVEIKHAIAPGLTGYVNYTDYEYKNGGEASTDDDGSVLQFKIAAKF
jgi:outer membrane protein OmpU